MFLFSHKIICWPAEACVIRNTIHGTQVLQRPLSSIIWYDSMSETSQKSSIPINEWSRTSGLSNNLVSLEKVANSMSEWYHRDSIGSRKQRRLRTLPSRRNLYRVRNARSDRKMLPRLLLLGRPRIRVGQRKVPGKSFLPSRVGGTPGMWRRDVSNFWCFGSWTGFMPAVPCRKILRGRIGPKRLRRGIYMPMGFKRERSHR